MTLKINRYSVTEIKALRLRRENGAVALELRDLNSLPSGLPSELNDSRILGPVEEFIVALRKLKGLPSGVQVEFDFEE